jgi:hypothetical protein
VPRSVPAMKKAQSSQAVSRKAVPRQTAKKAAARTSHSDALPDDVDATTIERLSDEAERGIPERKLRGRGRPPIGEEASSVYSVRLPDELVALVDERSAMDGVARGETIRRALIEYLTK